MGFKTWLFSGQLGVSFLKLGASVQLDASPVKPVTNLWLLPSSLGLLLFSLNFILSSLGILLSTLGLLLSSLIFCYPAFSLYVQLLLSI